MEGGGGETERPSERHVERGRDGPPESRRKEPKRKGEAVGSRKEPKAAEKKKKKQPERLG